MTPLRAATAVMARNAVSQAGMLSIVARASEKSRTLVTQWMPFSEERYM